MNKKKKCYEDSRLPSAYAVYVLQATAPYGLINHHLPASFSDGSLFTEKISDSSTPIQNLK